MAEMTARSFAAKLIANDQFRQKVVDESDPYDLDEADETFDSLAAAFTPVAYRMGCTFSADELAEELETLYEDLNDFNKAAFWVDMIGSTANADSRVCKFVKRFIKDELFRVVVLSHCDPEAITAANTGADELAMTLLPGAIAMGYECTGEELYYELKTHIDELGLLGLKFAFDFSSSAAKVIEMRG